MSMNVQTSLDIRFEASFNIIYVKKKVDILLSFDMYHQPTAVDFSSHLQVGK